MWLSRLALLTHGGGSGVEVCGEERVWVEVDLGKGNSEALSIQSPGPASQWLQLLGKGLPLPGFEQGVWPLWVSGLSLCNKDNTVIFLGFW